MVDRVDGSVRDKTQILWLELYQKRYYIDFRRSGNIYNVSNATAFSSYAETSSLPSRANAINAICYNKSKSLEWPKHHTIYLGESSQELFASLQFQQHPPVIPLVASAPNFTRPCPPAPGPFTPDRRSFKSYFPASIF